jgi:uncharacterized membrane protein
MPYTIIGGDAQQYGPIAEEDVRRWIAEGRLNAQSMAKTENEAAFRPLSEFPEFADAWTQLTPPAIAPPAPVGSHEYLERDYDLDIGRCISRAWELVKKNFWPVVGINFLVMLAIVVPNQLISLFTRPVLDDMIRLRHVTLIGISIVGSTTILTAPVYIVLMAGLYQYFLKLIRGQSATLGDAFSGFGPSFGQLILLGVVQTVLALIGYALCFFPGLYLNVAWFFAMPLVIDKRMDFWSALELSRKIVNKHWFVVFGFLIVYALVAVSGLIACCIGIFVTMPLGIATLMYGYESIFSEPRVVKGRLL